MAVSITTLDHKLARKLEPRATAPQRRLEIITRLTEAGIPVAVLVAPLIPVLTDNELETILEHSRKAGALHAGYILLRLPHELKDMFADWLKTHFPMKFDHVMSRIRDTRGGKTYDARFGIRMCGTGEFAGLIGKHFNLAKKRLGFSPFSTLDCENFSPPTVAQQLELL